jgi:hypothetical protein
MCYNDLLSLVEVYGKLLFSFIERFGDMLTCVGDTSEAFNTRIFDLLHALVKSSIDGFVETAVLQVLCKLIERHNVVCLSHMQFDRTKSTEETLLPTARREAYRDKWLFANDMCGTVQLRRFIGRDHWMNS